MEQLKHECGVALIRLRKPLSYYQEKYGSFAYGLNKLCLLMEKQHNRGQEGAGAACVKLSAEPGEEFMYRERAEGKNAISDLFSLIYPQIEEGHAAEAPFIGDCYMGHLRYSTTGRSGLSYVHPVLRRSNYRANTLALCGNFNLTNVDEVFADLKAHGQHPRRKSDTTLLLEQLGYELDEQAETQDKMESVLRNTAPRWDGGYVMCGLTGNGEIFAVRDPWGIRTAFYYADEEIIVVASERPVIQTVMDVPVHTIIELEAGQALIIGANGEMRLPGITTPHPLTACSFERIYFSRGSDKDIYLERKGLGKAVIPQLLKTINYDLAHTVFSFIPNTAEIAFWGMHEGLNDYLNLQKVEEIARMTIPQDPDALRKIIQQKIRIEKVAIKDIKLRTFISESNERNELVNHVYDITYGSLEPEVDNLVVIDDSIVRGTTLRQSIITILSRLNPRKLVIVSSAPQIRYPDFYGIDMSDMGDLVAFRAALSLHKQSTIDEVYRKCKEQQMSPRPEIKNYVQVLYASLSAGAIACRIAEFVTPPTVTCPVEIVFQDIYSLHEVCANHSGDWYFSGLYPTAGGLYLLNEAFIRFYEEEYRRI